MSYAVVRRVPNTQDVLEASIDEMDVLADMCVEESQGFCPVDEGDLVSTIRSEREGYDVEIIAGGIPGPNKFVHYAQVVHNGGGRGRNAYPRPFLTQGIEVALEEFATIQKSRLYESFYYGDESEIDVEIFAQTYRANVPSPVGRIPKGQPGAGRFFKLPKA
ncbi:MAG: hypothetical protein OXG15_04990 [Gammaproteobacteria bacterium]|nr:hypothetical protein [Gammaproteobacteria bacterium]